MPEDDFAKELEKSFNEAANNEGKHTPEKPSEQPSEPVESGKKAEENEETKEENKPEGEGEKQETGTGEEKETQPDAPQEKKTEDAPPQEQPTPLTKDDFKSIINELRNEERVSGRELEETTKTVIDAYYPNGLSRTLVDESGKELKTPQDVVDASGGTMDIEEATKWLMNEQFKLDKQISEIEGTAKQIAEQTVKFRRDGETVLAKYEPLFKAYPQVQKKVFDQYMKLVNYDKDKDVVLSAPDMEEFYDMVLDPYRLAFEYSQNKPATEPEKPAEPPKPTKDDRLDVSGDGGASEVDDPNDFAAQVRKELNRKD
jgi:hypothetical protein